jgi:hypothetical protein
MKTFAKINKKEGPCQHQVIINLSQAPGKLKKDGGGGEIRTHGRVTPTTIFKTVAFNRSATPPGLIIITETKKIIHCLMYDITYNTGSVI